MERKMNFTPEQQRVITETDSNILVSAAAGSGKTAVLVERIIRIITGEPQVDIDRLLIVTFTQAAASEMRERISAAVSRRLEDNPEDERLQKQSALIHNAQITTIDSFCLFVLRNNFNDIGLDPGFRVADEGEVKLLKQDVLKQVLEGYYEREDEGFLRLVESFSPNGNDRALSAHLSGLYEFAMSYPWPKEWLRGCADVSYGSVEEMEASPWMQAALRDCALVLRDAVRLCGRARGICLEPDGPYMYEGVLEEDEALLDRLLDLLGEPGGTISSSSSSPAGKEEAATETVRLERLFDALQEVSFSRLPVKKDAGVSADKREQVKGIRQGVKDTLRQMRERYFYKEPKEQLADLRKAQENVAKLAEVALAFHEAFTSAKRDKNIIDFQDMEHMALQILVRREDGEETPTDAALSYRQHFAEVLIDEYQDSNLVQEALLKSISGEAEGRHNRFMVGDVKQSIYKFRLARPELFMEKYDSYSREEGPCLRIDLHKNFRSRREVLDSVNDIFYRIMGKQLGGVSYDEEAALYPGAVFPDEAGGAAEEGAGVEARRGGEGAPYETELLLYDTEAAKEAQEPAEGEEAEEAGLTAREAEAHMVAGRIREIVGALPVTDRATGELRPAQYRDIVILLRSNQGWDEVFLDVLKGEGIPVYAASKTGYFAAREVQDILNYLRVIDNPLQDIPLFGVLKSVLGGFTEEELAKVRAAWLREREEAKAAGEGSEDVKAGREDKEAGEDRERLAVPRLYAMLGSYHEEEEICRKAGRFMERLERYRGMAAYTSISRLLRIILAETDYLYAAGALPGGGQRQANVEMLLAKAADFEQTSYYGLFHFIRYMEQMEKYDVDYGEANIQDENADTVRIMSIHKSKGLEFPVCFVSGLSKRFNRMDTSRPLLMDVDYGIGAQYVDTQLRYRQNTVKQNAIARKLLLDAQGEELRVLYVALTRAKEKLILTGSIADYEAKRQQALLYGGNGKDGVPEPGETLPFLALAQAGSYLDWILAAAPGSRVRVCVSSSQSLTEAQAGAAAGREYDRQRLLAGVAAGVSRGRSEELRRRFAFRYSHDYLNGLYTKTTVSELKKAAAPQEEQDGVALYPQEEVIPYFPRFVQEGQEVSATARGSAYHRAMEVLDFAALPEGEAGGGASLYETWLREQLHMQVRAGRLSKAYYDSINPAKAAAFLRTGLARRMAEADRRGQLYKERPFVLGIPASRLKPHFPETETVLVQGIIDLYLEEDGGLVVADYKTDRVGKPEELVRRYQVQLDYYAEALTRLTGRPVLQKIIYSFALDREIIL